MLDKLALSTRLYLAAGGTAFLCCLLLTPCVRRLAVRLNIVDRPDQYRKLHAQATPLGGGVAVFLSFLAAASVVFVLSRSQKAVLIQDTPFFVGLLLASLVICLVGLLDDRFGLRGRQKLMGQIAAAGVVVGSGLVIDNFDLFGLHVELGLLAVPFTVFWILGAINALNLIDGADGLATSVGLVLSLAIAGTAFLGNHPTEAFLAVAMAGTLAAFLIYNAPPASIFLGDAGSMLIGLVLGVLALRGSFKGPATAALAAPTAIWAIPAFDVGMAILRRKLTGRTLYATDRGHLHHTLQQRGFGGYKTVALIGALCAVTAVGALTSVSLKNELLAAGTVAGVLGTLIVCRVFGHHECSLLLRRVKHLVLSLVPLPNHHQQPARQLESRFQGDRQWNDLWQTLTVFAERFGLTTVQLSITMPALSEDYHATWRCDEQPEESQLWTSDMPLLAGDVTVGRLKLSGACGNGSVCSWMGDLITGLKPFETEMLDMLSDLPNHVLPAPEDSSLASTN